MRFLPLLTACLVALALYAVILERDALRAFANGTAIEAPEDAAPEEIILAQSNADAPVSVVAMTSRAAPVQSGIVLSGRTEAARKVQIRAQTTGLVISNPIEKGTRISEGDVLCELDPGTRPASLAEAVARLKEAETLLSTSERLAERGFSAETDTITKQAAQQSAQARVEQAQTELDRLTITAPFDGVLETNTAELGELMQPGGACATLISLDPIVLVGFVPEQDVEQLTLGSPAGARLITGQVLSGQVTFLSRSADEVTRTFRVEVQVPNPDRSIRDGVTAEILIGLEGETGHLLPLSSLTLNDEGVLGVRVADNGYAKFMPVDLIRDDSRGVWLGGLPEVVDVIVVGQDFVRDGRQIVATYREATQ